MYDAVILDSDGVLVELTGPDALAAVIERTYRSLGVDSPSAADREALWVGTTVDRVRAACERHGLDPEAVWERRDRLISAAECTAIRAGRKPLYDDVAALTALDRPLGVASNNLRTTVAYVLDRHGLTDHVGSVQARTPCLDGLSRRKPDPHYLQRALADLDAGTALFVGDSASDVKAARAAGIDAALLTRPDRDPADAAPDHAIESLAELPDLVAGG